jgi:extracellular elastinolytic metalloproteinase
MKKNLLSLLLLTFCAITAQISAQSNVQNLTDHFQQLLDNEELVQQDINYAISSEHTSSASGVHHIYFRQVVNSVEVFGTDSSIHILPNGNTLTTNNQFIPNVMSKLASNSPAALGAVEAVTAFANDFNYNITDNVSVIETRSNQEFVLSRGGISLSDIPAKLVYYINDGNEDLQIQLAWDLAIEEVSGQNWWNVRIDASNGAVLSQNNWIVTCSVSHDHSTDEAIVLDYNKNLYDIPNYAQVIENAAVPPISYEVIAMPTESPYFGPRTIVTNPANAVASPYGWHDTNGVAGAEFTVTRGNNVNAYEDGDNSGFQPDGGADLDFTGAGFPFDQVYSNATQYEPAAITNLFYWNNINHDVFFIYGYDEASGNFQENNYGGAGAGGDSVDAEAQDGSGTCNANFGTPPDGSNPRMQMYVCNDKDGDFDNLVITHEYGHGVSNRLTGGGNNTGCLGNSEQMGEGWSDYLGAVLTIEPGDAGTDARAVGTYLFGQGVNGGGIRPFPYSTDLAVNPHTYNSIGSVSVPHGVGSVWAEMLWEVTWSLIDTYGYGADIYNFNGDIALDAGNVMALALVMEGMKLQPCSPGFVDGRDAIFAADVAIYGGVNECLLWDAFAKRGLGVSASQGSSNSVNDGTEAFDTPSGVASFTGFGEACEGSAVITGLSGGTPFGGIYSGPGVTDDGNGNTYSFDPIAAGVGVHTITYEVMAGSCSVASVDTDTVEVIDVPDGPVTTGASGFCAGDPVTVTATLGDPLNVIRWYDAPAAGTFLFEGTSYTFNPTTTTSVYAQERPPAPANKLVVSEVTLETPDRLEIQNVGNAFDYTGYMVALSENPFADINTVNSDVLVLGNMAGNSVLDYTDQNGDPNYWGSNIWWGSGGGGWVIILDPTGNVADSAFWNFSEAEIATLNVNINGFNITAADLDWIGVGANHTASCDDSFKRINDTDSSADWSGICTTETYGSANTDIGDVSGALGCLSTRTETIVTAETEVPVITCPADETVTIPNGGMYTLPDYTGLTAATDNCTANPAITQAPAAGTQVGPGMTVVTMTATDEAGNAADCTFTVTVQEEILGVQDNELNSQVVLYPNPTNGEMILVNNSTQKLVGAIITDINGRLIQQVDLSNSNSETNISLVNAASGIYFIRITSESASVVKQIVKQ